MAKVCRSVQEGGWPGFSRSLTEWSLDATGKAWNIPSNIPHSGSKGYYIWSASKDRASPMSVALTHPDGIDGDCHQDLPRKGMNVSVWFLLFHLIVHLFARQLPSWWRELFHLFWAYV